MKEFINKWSNWWILYPERKQLDDAFEKELNELIEREVALRQPPVIRRWKFYYDGEEDDWTFEIEAKDHEEAFDKAYETHGPQVESMLYTEVKSNVD